jgi:hypothetical protein
MLDRRTALLAIGSLPVVPTLAAASRVVSQGTVKLRLCLDVKKVSIGYFEEPKISDPFYHDNSTGYCSGINPKGLDKTIFLYIGNDEKPYILIPCTQEESNAKICGNKYLESLFFKTDEEITLERYKECLKSYMQTLS